jgi:hypothetical protein
MSIEFKTFVTNNLAPRLFTAASLLCGLSHAAQAQQQKWEAAPVPPRPETSDAASVMLQSGVGSNVAFMRAGVVELGGSLSYANTEDFQSTVFSPSAGYFFMNNFQISLIGNMGYSQVKSEDGHGAGSIIVEPSFHYPLTNTEFVFAGMGVGALFETDEKTGTAVAPRVGYKMLVGRSGLLSFSFQPIIGLQASDSQYVNGTVVEVKRTNNLRVGYSVLL